MINSSGHYREDASMLADSIAHANGIANNMIGTIVRDVLPKGLGPQVSKSINVPLDMNSSVVPAIGNLNLSSFSDSIRTQADAFDAFLAETEEGDRRNWLNFRWSRHQLVIIGNGFDLQCGLPSSFKSFIEARKSALDGPDQEESNPLGFTKTIWDVIFAGHDDDDWCDIEGAIAEWVRPSTSGTSLLDKVVAKLKNSSLQVVPTFNPQIPRDSIARYLIGVPRESKGPWTKVELLSVTHRDLRTLERDFTRYLLNAIEESGDVYTKNAHALMSDILLDEFPDSENFDTESSVLSFNYTRPAEKLLTDEGDPDLEHLVTYINIHGRLDQDNIVFGIDGGGVADHPDIMPFTKTYRLMALDVPDTGSLIHVPSASSPRDGGTEVIKFYGHSLAKADYSYFQAIFDALNLYGGRTRLVFYFLPYDGKTEDEVREIMMGSVIRLLNSYSSTLDNAAHGRNLIHKLLIEGRLSVKRLPIRES